MHIASEKNGPTIFTLENNKSNMEELRGLFTSLKKGQLLEKKVIGLSDKNGEPLPNPNDVQVAPIVAYGLTKSQTKNHVIDKFCVVRWDTCVCDNNISRRFFSFVQTLIKILVFLF